jgi:hypothetical protein
MAERPVYLSSLARKEGADERQLAAGVVLSLAGRQG